MSVKVSPKELLEKGAHFGHQARRWNPKMKPFLYEVQNGVHIFDLIKTKEKLEEALEVIERASKKGEKILLLGTKKQVKDKVKEVAENTGCYYVNERWLGGTFTNFDQIKKSTLKLKELKENLEKGEYKERTKKERLLIKREIDRLDRFFGGVAQMQEIPEVIFVIDTKREAGAIIEASKKGVTTIAIVDSNCDPTVVDYPIPMNDDATKAVDYVLTLIQDTIIDSKKSSSKKVVSKGSKTKKKKNDKKDK